MKLVAYITIVTSSLASPLFALAQSSSPPVSRAEVRGELIRLEKAGLVPSVGEDNKYPESIMAAEAKVNAPKFLPLTSGSVGGTTAIGTSDSGSRTIASHDDESLCVRPIGFCRPYFGN